MRNKGNVGVMRARDGTDVRGGRVSMELMAHMGSFGLLMVGIVVCGFLFGEGETGRAFGAMGLGRRVEGNHLFQP